MLLAVPTEIVNKITIEADGQTRGRLRRTCKLLNSIATPLVFESVYIDLAWRRRSRAVFLNSLTSGPKLAQYIIRLSLYLPKRFRRHLSRFSTKSRTKKREEILDSFDGMLLAAIPLMSDLRTFSWKSIEDSGRKYTQLIIEKISCLPLLSTLNISTGFSSWDVSWAHFSHIRNITYFGCGGAELATFLGHNRNIRSIDASVWRPQGLLEEGKSISLLFSSLPPGTHSRVKKVTLDGNAYNQLYRHEIPTLIPHLRHLESLDIHILPPNEFWDGLREDEIYLASLSYCERTLERPLLSYLVSYTGLRKLSLWVSDRSTPDDVHVAGLLTSVITINSWSLTKFHVDTFDNVAWCLNHPMLDALSSCHCLKSLRVCVDKSVNRLDADRNVVDRVLEAALVSWPNLWYLGIYVAVSHSYGFEAIRITANQVHKRILAFRFTQSPPEGTPYVSSDFARYSAKIHDQKKNVHAFSVRHLKRYGKRELWRKCIFWKRSRDTNDD